MKIESGTPGDTENDARKWNPSASSGTKAASGCEKNGTNPAGETGLRRLSPGQLGLWFAQAISPGSPVLNQGEYLEIFGNLDTALFARVMRQIYAETDALHVRFAETDDGPRQYLSANRDRDNIHPLIDVSGEPDPKAAAIAWMRKDMTWVDDLIRGPIGTAALFRCGPEHYIFFQRGNHIVTDGLSGLLLVQRGADIYSALATGQPPGVGDWGSWFDLLDDEEDYRSSHRYQRDRDYWLAQFVNRPTPATLSGKPPGRSVGVIRCTEHLDRPLAESLRALGAAHRASLPGVITAAAALYLHRITGVRDLTIGMPLTARGSARMRKIVGMSANVLPVRLSIVPGESFCGLLDRVSDQMLYALRHQRYRGEDLRRDLGLRPDEGDLHGLVVNVMPFDYEIRFAGLSAHEHNLSLGPVNDFAIVAYDRLNGGDVRLYFDANPENYTPSSLAEHRRRFVHLLRTLAEGAGMQPVHSVDILPAEERRQLLHDFNRTARDVPDTTMPGLFEAQAGRTPDAVAVVCDDGSFTYRELNERANQLAHHLISLGVGPEDRVGICLGRSFEMVVALLAAQKAGAAYVPMDPDYPPSRLAYMARDASPVVVLSTEAFRKSLPQSAPVAMTVDAGDAPKRNVTDSDRKSPLLGTHPAYVIYTSGSTGTPKGVVVTQHALVNHMAWMADAYPLSASDRVLGRTSISFDAAVWELWLPLISGSALCLASRDTGRDPVALVDYIHRMGITIAQFVPSLLAAACNSGRRLGSRLRLVFSGGEVLDRRLAEKVAETEKAPVINLFGPTETTIQVTHYRFDGSGSVSETIPIGSPIWNTTAYVLDDRLQLVPIGAPGELYIGGAALARGYLNQPDLTAARFVPDPYGKAGSRMYRTGDLVRWRPDGLLEYLQRVDEQMKIRGFRIEPGEIEAALESLAGISRAAVTVRDAGQQLIAYVVPTPGEAPDLSTLRHALRERLPDFMVPSRFVLLDTLPLTPNGKLDRRALPAVDAKETSHHRDPRTPEEKILAGIFAEVLQVERLGIDDNFFALGGHSLLAATALARIRAVLGADLAFHTFFERPTVIELAQSISSKPSPDGGKVARLLPLRPHGDLPPLFCIPPGNGLSWGYSALIHEIDPRRPIYGLQSSAIAYDVPLPTCIRAIATEYADAIRALQPAGPYHLLGWSFGGIVAHDIACLLQTHGAEVSLLALLDSFPPGDRPHLPAGAAEAAADSEFDGYLTKMLGLNPGSHVSEIVKSVRSTWPEYDFLTDREIERVLEIWRNSHRLVMDFRPSVFEGEAMLFLGLESQARSDHRERWLPYITGHIAVHHVACPHLEMTRPEHLRMIGREVGERLRIASKANKAPQ